MSNVNTKWIYDQHFLVKDNFGGQPFKEPQPAPDKRKYRQGTKETQEQKLKKQAFAIRRNIAFNGKMKVLSIISLLFGGVIFTDHYLPPLKVYQTVYATFKPEEVPANSDAAVAIFLNHGRKLELYPSIINDEPVGLRSGEALFSNTPIFKVMKTVQVGKLVLKPFDSLNNIMLLFGVVCVCSLFVLAYKSENSLVLPTILTFFDNILVLTFFTMWLTEG